MTKMLSARLTRAEGEELVARYPELKSPAKGSVVAITVESEREAALVEYMLERARAYVAEQETAVQDLLDALLPRPTLRLPSGLLRQVELNALAQQALAEEFGLIDGKELARLQGSTASNAASVGYRLRNRGQIFGIDVAGEVRYPGFQFADDGRPLPVMSDILGVVDRAIDGWELALWFTGNNAWLGGLRPVDAMRGTNEDQAAVVAAARHLADELNHASPRADNAEPA